jgi:ABC-type glycerol-3-phosphate transport system permease component
MGSRKNLFWAALAAPGIIWLIVLFIVPFYAVLAIAMGKLNELFESPVAVWNPLAWSSENVIDVWHANAGQAALTLDASSHPRCVGQLNSLERPAQYESTRLQDIAFAIAGLGLSQASN